MSRGEPAFNLGKLPAGRSPAGPGLQLSEKSSSNVLVVDPEVD